MRTWCELKILLTLFLISSSANALLVKLTDLHTMAKRSDVVIQGYIGDQRVVTDDLGRHVTFTDVEVIDGLHGAKTGEVITIFQVGGEKDGIVMPLLGGQRYEVGREIFFFGLKIDKAFVSYGAGQGKLDIVREGKEDMVIEDLGDVESVSKNGQVVMRPMPQTWTDVETLKKELKVMLKN